MIILHIACTNGDMCNGVQVVVPQHLHAQSKFATVGFVNITNIKVNDVKQFEYSDFFSVSSLPQPFCKPDIVVFHEAYRIQYLRIAKELQQRRIPYIILPHGELSDEAQKKKYLKKFFANILLFNSFINKAAAIQLLSERELERTYFGKKKFIGTNGIDIPYESKRTFSVDGIHFIYIGRLDSYHKGLDILLEAFGKQKELLRTNRCTLAIYGPDYQGRYAHIQELIELNGVTDIVELNHEIFGVEKTAKLLGADVFVQTSRFEGMPIGILEAMSYGLPCLVTEGTTLKNFIEENDAGWGAETNSDSVAQALNKIISERNKLEAKSGSALKVVKDRFSWDSIAYDTVNYYMSIYAGPAEQDHYRN